MMQLTSHWKEPNLPKVRAVLDELVERLFVANRVSNLRFRVFLSEASCSDSILAASRIFFVKNIQNKKKTRSRPMSSLEQAAGVTTARDFYSCLFHPFRLTIVTRCEGCRKSWACLLLDLTEQEVDAAEKEREVHEDFGGDGGILQP